MAIWDCRYVNGQSASVDLNGGSYRLVSPGPRGIYSLAGEPHLVATLRRLPPSLYLAHKYQPREIVAPIRVVGSSWSNLATRLKALWDVFYVDVRDGTLGTWTYTAPNGVERSIGCALAKGVDADEWYVAGANDPANAILNIPLVCPDPTFYDPTPVVAGGAFSGTSSVSISCANAGDTDAYAALVYTTDSAHTLVNPQVTDAYGNAIAMRATVAVSTSLHLVLDPNRLSMTDSDGANWFGRRSVTSTHLALIKPGTHDLVFTAENADANAAITVSFHSRYAAHG
jgi:hypothetical protein